MIKIIPYTKETQNEIFIRTSSEIDVSSAVSEIIKNVRENKDEALKFYAKKFDGVELDCLEVSATEIEEAFSLISKDLLDTIVEAEKNIRFFHYERKLIKF